MFTVTFTYSKDCYLYFPSKSYTTETRCFDTEAQARDYVHRLSARSRTAVFVPQYSPAAQPLRGVVVVCDGDRMAYCWSAPTAAVQNTRGWVVTSDSFANWK